MLYLLPFYCLHLNTHFHLFMALLVYRKAFVVEEGLQKTF